MFISARHHWAAMPLPERRTTCPPAKQLTITLFGLFWASIYVHTTPTPIMPFAARLTVCYFSRSIIVWSRRAIIFVEFIEWHAVVFTPTSVCSLSTSATRVINISFFPDITSTRLQLSSFQLISRASGAIICCAHCWFVLCVSRWLFVDAHQVRCSFIIAFAATRLIISPYYARSEPYLAIAQHMPRGVIVIHHHTRHAAVPSY